MIAVFGSFGEVCVEPYPYSFTESSYVAVEFS